MICKGSVVETVCKCLLLFYITLNSVNLDFTLYFKIEGSFVTHIKNILFCFTAVSDLNLRRFNSNGVAYG